jgi:hypothetical protein
VPIAFVLTGCAAFAAALAVVAFYWTPYERNVAAKQQLQLQQQKPQVDQKAAADKIYAGSILIPERGTRCTEMVFDNRTGQTWDRGIVDCGDAI